MSRKPDVDATLASVAKQFVSIRHEYAKALRDQSLDLRIPVKNLMENLRSALDYMAHDIYDSCCRVGQTAGRKQAPKVYFPFGRDDASFKSSLGSSLPGLQTQAPAVHNLILAMQPFQCGDDWLCDLCSIVNENKHNRLQAQVRSETETHTVESEFGSVTIPVNNPNMKITSMPGAVKVFGVPAQFTGEGILTAPSSRIKHTRTKWVAFTFEGTEVNVIGLLEKAVTGVTAFSGRLYRQI